MARKYYLKELTRLRELGQEFGERNPNIAPMLTQDATDPDVERLLEGFAYLTSGIQEKIDDQYSEVVNTLTDIFFPEYLKPIPSACMVEFEPQAGVGRPVSVLSHSEYASEEIDGTACHFRPQYDSVLQPFTIEKQEFKTLDNGQTVLQIDFNGLGMPLSEWQAEELKFYVAGPTEKASLLFLLIMRYCDKITIQGEGSSESYLPADSLQNEHSFWDEAFLNAKNIGAPNTYFLSQYFTFPQQFLQFSLSKLNTWQERGNTARFSVQLHFSELPRWYVNENNVSLKINAIPLQNLMQKDAVPLNLDHTHFEYRMRIDTNEPDHYQIVTVSEVDGFNRASKAYTHYVSAATAIDAQEELSIYELSYHNKIGADNPEIFISFHGQDEANISDEVVSIGTLCCNGKLAETIQPGKITKGTESSVQNVRFKNLHSPSKYYPINMDESLRWRFITLLSYNFLGEASLNKLKEIILLELDVLQGIERKKVESRLEGIRELTINHGNVLYQGHALTGYDISMTFQLRQWLSEGEIFLFACVLERYFATIVPINTYVKLSVEISETGEMLTWPARTIDKRLQ